ncbi:MAG: TIGR03663 family protein [bacterium]|nr:TIGR03663 family protein [bacterium]
MVFLSSRKNILYISLFLLIILFAAVIRFPDLARRPMHTDEAVNAVKFGSLLEENNYKYDKNEYHGPVLYYVTLIPALLASADDLNKLTESILRITPAFFGLLLIILLLIIAKGIGRPAVLAAGLLTAMSPAMVFYSRYYIHEMLFVFFAFAVLVCCYSYIKGRQIGWAVGTGISLGLLHATKETGIIVVASMLTALFIIQLIEGKASDLFKKVNYRHAALICALMIAVSALFYSSFFKNPSGIIESYAAYKNYLSKAVNDEWHVYPWYYYLKLLVFPGGLSMPIWTEFYIVVLAAAGILAGIFKRGINKVDIQLVRFISIYTIILIIIYSAIPYKTPWNMLVFLHGLILLAGVGAVSVYNIASNKYTKALIIIFFVIAGRHLIIQSFSSNIKYYADPVNPYVYAHTTDDIFHIVNEVESVAEIHPDGNNIYIEVICSGDDYWPLPWYLRSFPNAGWWSEVDMDVPAAPVIIVSPDMLQDLTRKLYELPEPGEKNLYVSLLEPDTEIRPSVGLHVYVEQELWDKYQQNKK